MLKTILQGEVRDVSYCRASPGMGCLIPCTNNSNRISNGSMVTLAKFSKNGIEITKSRIGNVISVCNDNIKVRFDTSVVFNDNLYAIIDSNIKPSSRIILAYQED